MDKIENTPAGKEFRDSLLLGRDTAEVTDDLAIAVYPYETVSSTMDIAHQLIRDECIECFPLTVPLPTDCRESGESWVLPQIRVVQARSQCSGRGRYRRVWQSPLDAGLYLSFIFPAPHPDIGLSGFSLALGLAVVDAAASFGVSAGLKWPNDVLVAFPPPRGFAKLAGILVETTPVRISSKKSGCSVRSDSEEEGVVIAGIGLNIRGSTHLSEVNGVALEELARRDFSYAEAFRALSRSVLVTVNRFYQVGFGPFVERWNSLSLMSGRNVTWSTTMGSTVHSRGTVLGVDSQGGLVVSTEAGRQIIYCGEVTFCL